MGLGSFLNGLPLVGEVFRGLTGTAQARATTQAAGYQAQVSTAQVQSQERMFDKQLAFDREKWGYLKAQTEQAATRAQAEAQAEVEIAEKMIEAETEIAKAQAKSRGQVGTYGYPYVSVKPGEKKPSLVLPLAIGTGFFYFFIVRRKR
jgi:hypothetical protein